MSTSVLNLFQLASLGHCLPQLNQFYNPQRPRLGPSFEKKLCMLRTSLLPPSQDCDDFPQYQYHRCEDSPLRWSPPSARVRLFLLISHTFARYSPNVSNSAGGNLSGCTFLSFNSACNCINPPNAAHTIDITKNKFVHKFP